MAQNPMSSIWDTCFSSWNSFLEYSHLVQHKKLPKKLSLETFRVFSDIFGVYDDILRHVPEKPPKTRNFAQEGSHFLHKKCFLDHSGILSEKNRKNSFQKSGRDPMGPPSYVCIYIDTYSIWTGKNPGYIWIYPIGIISQWRGEYSNIGSRAVGWHITNKK